MTPKTEDAAHFDEEGLRRYWLTRENLHPFRARTLVIIGANPSKATATEGDPTVDKEIKFARAWRFGRLVKVNAYAWCATDPRDMWEAQKAGHDIVGRNNDNVVQTACLNATKVMLAWGKIAKPDRVRQLIQLLDGIELYCWRMNKDGSPTHPLYLADSTMPIKWNSLTWRNNNP